MATCIFDCETPSMELIDKALFYLSSAELPTVDVLFTVADVALDDGNYGYQLKQSLKDKALLTTGSLMNRLRLVITTLNINFSHKM